MRMYNDRNQNTILPKKPNKKALFKMVMLKQKKQNTVNHLIIKPALIHTLQTEN